MHDGVTVTFLGTGDAFGTGGRLQTCFHVRTPDASLLIDCGASACVSMKRYGVRHEDIDAVLISHYHADHFGGLPFLLIEGRVTGRTAPLTVAGPGAVADRVLAAMDVLFPGAGADVPYPVEYIGLAEGEPCNVGPARVTAVPVVHAPDTQPNALRVEIGGAIISYSGDTEWHPALIDIARGADLFICELSGFDGPGGIHLDYATLLLHRPALECGRLVLTHMGQQVLDNAEHVAAGLDATLAHDGMVIRL